MDRAKKSVREMIALISTDFRRVRCSWSSMRPDRPMSTPTRCCPVRPRRSIPSTPAMAIGSSCCSTRPLHRIRIGVLNRFGELVLPRAPLRDRTIGTRTRTSCTKPTTTTTRVWLGWTPSSPTTLRSAETRTIHRRNTTSIRGWLSF